MDESALFMEWAMETLEYDGDRDEAAAFPSLDVSHAALVLEELLTDAHAASSGETDGGVNFSSTAPSMDQLPPSPPANASPCGNGGGPNVSLPSPVMSWNFSAASAQPAGPLDASADPVKPFEPGLTTTSRRASAPKGTTSTGHMPTPAPYAQDHIIAERKRREKINQRFIELSTVTPGLKKMDKATILSDATRHVKDLQEKIKALEAASSSNNCMRAETAVLVRKPCAGAAEENGSGSSASSGAPTSQPLPEIEVRFAEKGVMVRILCDDGKGVVARVLSEVEDGLHLSVTHAHAMAFAACTLVITITAKVEEGFNVTAEQVVGRLNSALQQHSTCNTCTEETGKLLSPSHKVRPTKIGTDLN